MDGDNIDKLSGEGRVTRYVKVDSWLLLGGLGQSRYFNFAVAAEGEGAVEL